MLKKKSLNKIFLFFLISLLFFYSSIVLANIDVKQGDDINDDFLSKIYIGMSKNEVLKKFGIPILLPNCDSDCFCYYYYYFPLDKSTAIEYRYVLMFFNKSLLVSYFLKV